MSAVAGAHVRLDDLIPRHQEKIKAKRTPMMVRLASAVAAVVLLMLPVMYITIIGLLAWLALDYMLSHLLLLAEGESLGVVLAYAAPAALVFLIILLLVKPAFRIGSGAMEPITLNSTDQPLLFSYLDRICEVLQTPKPHAVRVDLSSGASASFDGPLYGLFSGKLTLNLGLTLIAGLDVRALTAVIAHELGHFVNQRGMRLNVTIFAINGWFSRVVYDRDAFDYWVYRISLPGWGPLRVVAWFVGLIMSIGRRLLWCLMLLAHAATCYISRRSEYESDQYSAALVGSESVQQTLTRTVLLDFALNQTLDALAEAWRNERLADNIPEMTRLRINEMDDKKREQLIKIVSMQQTGWLDTHPCLMDRASAAKRSPVAGIVEDGRPASGLIRDFYRICSDATQAFYQRELAEKFDKKKLVSAEKLAEEFATQRRALKAVHRFYQCEPTLVHPILPTSAAHERCEDPDQAAAKLYSLRSVSVEEIGELKKAVERHIELEEKDRLSGLAEVLLSLGVPVNAVEFRMPVWAVNNSQKYRDKLKEEITEVDEGLKELFLPLRSRIDLSLQLLRDDDGSRLGELEDVEERLKLAEKLLTICPALEKARDKVAALSHHLFILSILLENVDLHAASRQVLAKVEGLTARAKFAMEESQKALDGHDYPFEHGQGRVKINAFLLDHEPEAKNPVDMAIVGNEFLSRYDGMVARVMGQLIETAERVELAIGLPQLEQPEVKDPFEELIREMESNGGRPVHDPSTSGGGAQQLGMAAVVAVFMFFIGIVAAGGGMATVPSVPRHEKVHTVIVPESWNHPVARGSNQMWNPMNEVFSRVEQAANPTANQPWGNRPNLQGPNMPTPGNSWPNQPNYGQPGRPAYPGANPGYQRPNVPQPNIPRPNVPRPNHPRPNVPNAPHRPSPPGGYSPPSGGGPGGPF